jgi:hypothetical protein
MWTMAPRVRTVGVLAAVAALIMVNGAGAAEEQKATDSPNQSRSAPNFDSRVSTKSAPSQEQVAATKGIGATRVVFDESAGTIREAVNMAGS